jgi:hypothetical protein
MADYLTRQRDAVTTIDRLARVKCGNLGKICKACEPTRPSAPRGVVCSANQGNVSVGLITPDQSYSRTSLVRMLPIGVGGGGVTWLPSWPAPTAKPGRPSTRAANNLQHLTAGSRCQASVLKQLARDRCPPV